MKSILLFLLYLVPSKNVTITKLGGYVLSVTNNYYNEINFNITFT